MGSDSSDAWWKWLQTGWGRCEGGEALAVCVNCVETCGGGHDGEIRVTCEWWRTVQPPHQRTATAPIAQPPAHPACKLKCPSALEVHHTRVGREREKRKEFERDLLTK